MITVLGAFEIPCAGTATDLKVRFFNGYGPSHSTDPPYCAISYDTGSDTLLISMDSSIPVRLLNEKGDVRMELREVEQVLETIDMLVAELGPDSVPDEVDVDLARKILENEYGRQEEVTKLAMASTEEGELVEAADISAAAVERVAE
jgi:hypothetical protein